MEFIIILVKTHYNTHSLVLPDKNLINKDFALLTQIFMLLVWVPQIVKTFPILM